MIPGGVDIPHVDDGPSEARVWGSVGKEERRSEGREAQTNRAHSNDVPTCGWRGGDCQPCLPSVSVSDLSWLPRAPVLHGRSCGEPDGEIAIVLSGEPSSWRFTRSRPGNP
jgi:hypothetical protein